MKYDFDSIIDRRNTNSLKWDVGDGELPMWVADMDFKTAPQIIEAVCDIAKKGVYGYSIIPDEWYRAYIGWWEKRHGYKMEKSQLIFATGVIPAISSIVRKLTTPAEKILIQTPVYNVFFNSIINNGRRVLECPLRYEKNEYAIDFDDLEEKLSDPQTAMMILCNPHNPVGKIWSKEELERIGELCFKYSVIVLSDEIHCDLTDPGYGYVPFASVSEKCRDNSVTCIAPSKAFNLAGIQSSAVAVSNRALRNRVWRGLNTDEAAEPNVFAAAAAIAAFTKGDGWLDELRAYIAKNKRTASEFIKTHIPRLKVVESHATYLMWIDCSEAFEDPSRAAKQIREKTGLYLSDGSQYGGNGKNFLRMNAACPKETLLDGLERLKDGTRRAPDGRP